MVKFELKPWRKVVINEIIFQKLRQMVGWLATRQPMGAVTSPIVWVGNWAFLIEGMPKTDGVVNEMRRGVLRWPSLVVSYFGSYAPLIETREKVRIPVLDGTVNRLFVELKEWLLETFPEEMKRLEASAE